MAQISRFWDGTALGDAVVAPYDAGTEFSEVMTGIAGASRFPDRGGVIETPQGTLDVSTPAAGTIRVSPGEALVYGAWYRNDANVDHVLPAPASAPRIDRIILRKSWTSQTVRLLVISGVEGGSAPVLTRNVGATWDIPIAQINVAVGGGFTITDQRTKLGIPDVDIIFTDPVVRDTLYFGAKPSGSADALWRRISAGHLAAPNHVITQGILQVDGPPAQERALKFMTNGGMRWFWGIGGGDAGSGGNTGGNLGLYRYADDGTYLGQVFRSQRTDGAWVWYTSGFFNAGFYLSDSVSAWRHTIENNQWVVRNPVGTNMMVMGPSGDIGTPGNINAGGGIGAGSHLYSNGGYVYAGSVGGSYVRVAFNGEIFANNGQSITVHPTSAFFHAVNTTVSNGHPSVPWADVWANHISCYGDIVTNAALRMHGGVGSIVAIANISLSPAGGCVHPDGDSNRDMGHASLQWKDFIGRRLYSPNANPLMVEAGNGAVFIQARGNGSPVNLFSDTGQMQFQTGDGFAIMPLRHNTVHMGSAALRWKEGWGVGGWNSTSHRAAKQNWSDLPAGQALAALRLIQFGRFEYKVPESVAQNALVPIEHRLSMWTVGYIAEDTVAVTQRVGGEDLFIGRTGRDVEAQRTASAVGAAVQDLDREIHEELAMLRARIEELEREKVYTNGAV